MTPAIADAEHATAVSFELCQPDGWVEAVSAFEATANGHDVVLYGQCRRCDHEMSVTLPKKQPLKIDGAVVGQTLTYDSAFGWSSFRVLGNIIRRLLARIIGQSDAEVPSTLIVTACCNCASAHDGRPATQTEGCGAFANLQVKFE
jgi:hypothetical protein